MDWEQKIEKLAGRARDEKPPQVDVSYSVLSLLSSGQARPVTAAERLWMWMAAASAAVATPAAIIAGLIHRSSAGPLREVLESIMWAM
jgi:hypothetical protein